MCTFVSIWVIYYLCIVHCVQLITCQSNAYTRLQNYKYVQNLNLRTRLLFSKSTNYKSSFEHIIHLWVQSAFYSFGLYKIVFYHVINYHKIHTIKKILHNMCTMIYNPCWNIMLYKTCLSMKVSSIVMFSNYR